MIHINWHCVVQDSDRRALVAFQRAFAHVNAHVNAQCWLAWAFISMMATPFT